MAMEHKILGQQAPAGTSSTVLYEVPSGREAITSTLVVCNRTSGEIAFDVAVIPDGDTLADDNYIYFNIACPGRDSFTATIGLTLESGDSIEVKDRTGNSLTFSVYGVEVVPE